MRGRAVIERMSIMKKSRKLITAAIVMAMLLTGCGEPTTATTGSTATSTTAQNVTTEATTEVTTETGTVSDGDGDSCIGDDALVY